MRWLLLLLISAALAGHCRAEIECFTNGISAYLFDHFGQGGLIKCKSATECFESLANSQSASDSTIKYSSGCTACVKWSFDSDCKKCNTPLCNTELAQKIADNNLLCYFADDEGTMGEKRVWCSKDAGTCYHLEYKNKYNENRYHAGCGKGWSGCKTCTSSLCNIPDTLRASAQPASNVNFVALSKGLPATGGKLKNPHLIEKKKAEEKNEKDETSSNSTANSKAKSSKARKVYSYDYDYDGCRDTKATVAVAVAGTLLSLWARLRCIITS